MNFSKDYKTCKREYAYAQVKAETAGFKLAAPSWVFPGSVAENCEFLAGKVDEVGLLFMEAASALSYSEQDLPRKMASLPLEWHVHLPGDLNWYAPKGAADICLELMAKIEYLGAKRAVLHPPCATGMVEAERMAALETFILSWKRAGRHGQDLLLENLRQSDLKFLHNAAKALDCSLCLDLAHLIISGQELPGNYLDRVRLLHLCAPDPGGGKGHHHPLTALDSKGMETGRQICLSAGPETVFMLELFNWEELTTSLPVLRSWME